MLPVVQALRFLQTDVVEVADHVSAEGDVLRELIAPFLERPISSSPSAAASPEAVTPETFRAGREVYEQLMVFFPSETKEASPMGTRMINWYKEGRGD